MIKSMDNETQKSDVTHLGANHAWPRKPGRIRTIEHTPATGVTWLALASPKRNQAMQWHFSGINIHGSKSESLSWNLALGPIILLIGASDGYADSAILAFAPTQVVRYNSLIRPTLSKLDLAQIWPF